MTRLIFVDDDPGIQDVYRMIFDKGLYDVTVYSNGACLMENNFELPDMFILDKQMPGYDGLQICRFLKNQDRTKSIPVIMVSASPNTNLQAIKAGADHFLEKPFRLKVLCSLIDQYTSVV